MKKLLLIPALLLLVIGFYSCGSSPDYDDWNDDWESEEGSPEWVVEEWITAIEEFDAEWYADLYWPDAYKEVNLGNGPRVFEGREEIYEQILRTFDMVDEIDVDYSDPFIEDIEPGLVAFHFYLPSQGIHESLFLEERDGEWKIMEHFAERAERLLVKSEFQEWADENGNGWLEEYEYEELFNAAVELIMATHENYSPLDEMFDFDENGEIGPRETDVLREYFFGPGLDRLIEDDPDAVIDLLDMNWNDRIDDKERITAREYGLRFDHFDMREVEVESPFDEMIDFNEDGYLDEGEQIEMFYLLYEAIYLQEHDREMVYAFISGDEGGPIESPDEGTNTAEKEEERSGKSTVKTTVDLKDKKIAVVGVESLHSSITSETVQGLLLFIENSFVNSGKVRVIDRQNIEKIAEEYKFQSTSLTDQETAVQIGKLANADLIVTGALSKVGDQYYLNVKLIDVETGEIVGSSIANASVEDVFYQMCNAAVSRMLQ